MVGIAVVVVGCFLVYCLFPLFFVCCDAAIWIVDVWLYISYQFVESGSTV